MEAPPLLDRKEFFRVTGSKFSESAFDHFADHDGMVSRERLVHIANSADVYLSHEWGVDELARGTHSRALCIGQYLLTKGLFFSADNGQPLNGNDRDYSSRIATAVGRAQCVLVCLTRRYYEQLEAPGANTTKEEFHCALSAKGPRLMIPVLMESGARIAAGQVPSVIWEHFRNRYCIDLSQMEDRFTSRRGPRGVKVRENALLDDLADCVCKTVHPLRDGGDYRVLATVQESTVEGRHYSWLKAHLPELDHPTCSKYAQLFSAAGVQTSSKLFHRLQVDGQYLVKLGVTNAAHAQHIRAKLYGDLSGNMDVVNAARIDGVIAQARAVEQQKRDEIACQKAISDDIATKNYETIAMAAEDALSVTLREVHRESQRMTRYHAAKSEMLLLSLEETAQLSQRIAAAQARMFALHLENTDQHRVAEYVHISSITDGVRACIALRHLLLKIQREIDHHGEVGRPAGSESDDILSFVLQATSGEGQMVASSDDAPLLISNEAHHNSPTSKPPAPDCSYNQSQQEKIKAYITRQQTDSHHHKHRGAPTTNDHGLLYNLLQESVYVLHLLVVLSRDNPRSEEHIAALGQNSVVKLWTALMSTTYLFNHHFDSCHDGMPYSYRRLAAPLEGLRAMKYLCRYSAYRRSINLRNIYLFAAGNAVPLCLEIVKFHLLDSEVVQAALECVLLVLDCVQYYKEHCAALLADRSNLLLLLMVVEKYNSRTLDPGLKVSDSTLLNRLHIQTTVCNILSLAVRTATSTLHPANTLLESLHVQHTVPPLLVATMHHIVAYLDSPIHIAGNRGRSKTAVQAYESSELQYLEISCRVVSSLDCLFFDHRHTVDLRTTEDVIASPHLISQQAMRQFDSLTVLQFIARLFVRYEPDVVMSRYLVTTVRNVVHRSEVNKAHCARLGVVEHVTRVMRVSAACHFGGGVDAGEARETLIECLLALNNLIILQHDTSTVALQYSGDGTASASCHRGRRGATEPPKDRSQLTDREASSHILSWVVEQGTAEVVLDVLKSHSGDRSLLRAGLILTGKLVHRGLYLTCQRFVQLGICEKVRIFSPDVLSSINDRSCVSPTRSTPCSNTTLRTARCSCSLYLSTRAWPPRTPTSWAPASDWLAWVCARR